MCVQSGSLCTTSALTNSRIYSNINLEAREELMVAQLREPVPLSVPLKDSLRVSYPPFWQMPHYLALNFLPWQLSIPESHTLFLQLASHCSNVGCDLPN